MYRISSLQGKGLLDNFIYTTNGSFRVKVTYDARYTYTWILIHICKRLTAERFCFFEIGAIKNNWVIKYTELLQKCDANAWMVQSCKQYATFISTSSIWWLSSCHQESGCHRAMEPHELWYFLCCAPEEVRVQTLEFSFIWVAITITLRHCNTIMTMREEQVLVSVCGWEEFVKLLFRSPHSNANKCKNSVYIYID